MTEWWQTEDMFGHLYEVLGHIKHARTSSTRKSTVICGVLFEALNRTWTAFNDLQKEPARADTPSLTKLIEGIPMYRKEEFLDSKELQSLVEFEPHVMNHDTLRRGGYRPGKKIEPHLMSKATEEH